MERIFVMNLGTTSFKFKLYDCGEAGQSVLATGELECIGSPVSRYEIKFADGDQVAGETPITDHGMAFDHCFGVLQSNGILKDMGELTAVAYKAVHGGNLSGTRYVDDEVIREMERVLPLAPAHNPIYLSAMKSIRSRYPELKQIARFETSFHATIPEKRVVYSVPYEWKEELGVRRWGFHGSSHQYIAETVAKLQPNAKKVISCHLGGSSSICAILDGKSVATSMGATLQTGMPQNNRVGDFEVFCLPYIMDKYDLTLEQVLEILSKKSGLLGMSGVSNHFHLVQAAADEGNRRAKLTMDAYADQLLGIIGSYTAYLGGLDALVFTGGIGYRADRLRKTVCDGLGYLGMKLDDEKNRDPGAVCVSSDDSRISVYRIKTDEESVVVRCALELLHN